MLVRRSWFLLPLFSLSMASLAGCAKAPATAPSIDAAPDMATPVDAGGDLAAPALAGTVALPTAGAIDMSPFAFGQNYWNWEPQWGAAVAGTDALMKTAGVRLIRAGGANNEIQTPDVFTNDQLDSFVSYCRLVGAEPDLQVSLVTNAAGQPATAADAAAMVTYANVTKGYGIKYWSIGNEPDLYTMQGLQGASYTADDYCTTFRAYATAMKAVDPTIKILGPELSWKYVSGNDWLTPFLDGCQDVVDVVSVHRYPFGPTATTVAAAFGDAASFRQTVSALRANLDRHGMTATPLALTEEHITYDGDPAKSTLPASPQTFYAGMWAADVLGVALEEGLWTSAFWHIADTSDGWKLAFVQGGMPMPTYHAYALIATHFTGKVIKPTGVPTGFSVYANRDAGAGVTAVLVLNKTTTDSRLALTFDTLPTQTLEFPAQSMTMLRFTDDGMPPQVIRYTKALADAGAPPAPAP